MIALLSRDIHIIFVRARKISRIAIELLAKATATGAAQLLLCRNCVEIPFKYIYWVYPGVKCEIETEIFAATGKNVCSRRTLFTAMKIYSANKL